MTSLELATFRSTGGRSNQLSYMSIKQVILVRLVRFERNDLWLRRPVLYPAELQPQMLAPVVGLEPNNLASDSRVSQPFLYTGKSMVPAARIERTPLRFVV